MRLVTVNCIAFLCIATTIVAEETQRNKRHLSYLKDLLTSKIFGIEKDEITPVLGSPAVIVENTENFKLYRIPGFDNVLVKAIPKVNTNIKVKEPCHKSEKETITVLESYLGTKTPNQTVVALQSIKNLLQSGILTAQKDASNAPHFKETVFVVPSLVPEVKVNPIIIEPPKVPFLPPRVHNVVLPNPRLIPVQPISIAPPSSYSYKQMHSDGSVTTYTSKNGHDVVVTEINKPPPPPPAFIIDRLQQLVNMPIPIAPVPIQPALSRVPSYIEVKPMKPFREMDIPFEPLITPPSSIIVEPRPVGIQLTPYPYRKPCCRRQEEMIPHVLVKDTVAEPANPSFIIKEEIPAKRPPVLVKDTVVLPGTPSFIIDRLENIAGERITHTPIVTIPPFAMPSRKSIIEQSKAVHVYPSPTSWILPSDFSKKPNGNHYSFKLVNTDSIKSTFPDVTDHSRDYGFVSNIKNKKRYFQSGDEKIFYSHLVNGHDYAIPRPLTTQDAEDNDEEKKKHRKNQFTITNVEEHKKIADDEEVYVTYGVDKDNNPFLSYKVPSGGFSYEQVKHFGKLPELQGGKTEATITHIPKLPSDPISVQYSYEKVKHFGKITEDESKNTEIPTVTQIPKLASESGSQGNTEGPLKIGGIHESSSQRTNSTTTSTGQFSYKQIHTDGSTTMYVGDNSVQQTPQKVEGHVVIANNHQYVSRNNGILMFENPRYVYKQISHSNPKPLVFVPVEDKTKIAIDKGEVQVKVNPHEHVRPDGSKYLCTKLHYVPSAIMETVPSPIGPVVPTVPKDFIYVPPLNAKAPFPSSHVIDNPSVGQYSYKIMNGGSLVKSTESHNDVYKFGPDNYSFKLVNSETKSKTTEAPNKSVSFNEKPIVVTEENDSKQEKDKLESQRGDVPDSTA